MNFDAEVLHSDENNIPKLYETDGIPFEKKIIYQKWDLKKANFYWLIAELDKDKNLAFGYANLSDDNFAEWGHINIEELLDNNAVLDRSWKPVSFEEALSIIKLNFF